jgi:ADP-heptose:LPS heptosyltransferase
MRHGLGDNAQFTIVTKHIKHYFPDWHVDMEIGKGKESYFKHFANKLFLRKQDKYDYTVYDNLLDVDWPTPEVCSSVLPSSKPTRFLQNYLRLDPIEDLYRGYDITITQEEKTLASIYVDSLPKPFVIIHYLAKTLKNAKSLTHKDAAFICKQVIHYGYVPVILDWKKESPLPDNKTIFNPDVDNPIWKGEKLSSAGTIAALISRAKLYIGVDSGPLHTAGCTKTPALGIWHGHHPVNFFDLCDNVTHLVPLKARRLQTIKGKQKKLAKNYFEKSYKHFYYGNLRNAIAKELEKRL